MTVLLTLQQATATHGHKSLFTDISFSVFAKEFVSIIGPNGAGKTSLLKAIIGSLPLAKGKIKKDKRCRIGYMPQRLDLNTLMPLPVRTFLELTVPSKRNQKDHFESIVRETGIQKLLSSQVHDLSGGEYQRVMLAQALLRNPNLLILDEPTQGLDPEGELQFMSLLEHLNTHHDMAILMVSHDLHFVHKASQKVICIQNHLCCSGKPEDIKKDRAYVNLYVPRDHHDREASPEISPGDSIPLPLKPYVHAQDGHENDHNHDNLEKPQCAISPATKSAPAHSKSSMSKPMVADSQETNQ